MGWEFGGSSGERRWAMLGYFDAGSEGVGFVRGRAVCGVKGNSMPGGLVRAGYFPGGFNLRSE